VLKFWVKAFLALSAFLAACFPGPGSAAAEPVPKNWTTAYLPDGESLTAASNVSPGAPGYVFRFAASPLTMRGVDSSHDYFYQVPGAEIGTGSYIELDWTASDLVLPSQSTLTVMVDDKPLASVFLAKGENKTKIPLGKDEVSAGYHKLTLINHEVLTGELCGDQTNPANWLKISSSSYVFLDTGTTWKMHDLLKNYPFPFIEPGTPDEIYGIILLPDSPSPELVSAALQVAASWYSQTSGKNAVPILTESEWQASGRLTHVLALGSVGDWKGTVAGMIGANGIRPRDEEISLDNFSLSDPASGSTRQMLLVSAAADSVICEKIRVLADPDLAKQLDGNHLVIRDTPRAQNGNEKAEPMTLASFGYDHLLLNAASRDSGRLSVPIPSYWKISGEGKLLLKLKISPLLMSEPLPRSGDQTQNHSPADVRNGLTITVNGIPKTISLNELRKDNADSDTYTVSVPLNLPDADTGNGLDIALTANINGNDPACRRNPDDGKWIFVDKSSSLEIPHETVKEPTFRYWPGPFVDDQGLHETAFVLPEQTGGPLLTQLALLVSDMASRTGNLPDLAVVREPVQPDDLEILRNRNVIVLGGIDQHPSLKGAGDKMLVPSASGQLQWAGYPVIDETADSAAWIQPSVWNPNLAMAVFQPAYPLSGGAAAYVGKSLLDALNSGEYTGQIVVLDKSGNVLPVDLKQSAASPENRKASGPGKKTVFPPWIWAFIVVVFLGVLFAATRLWRKQRKNGGKL